jgi:hypothetical protein
MVKFKDAATPHMSGLLTPETEIIFSTNKRESNDTKNKTYYDRFFMGAELETKYPFMLMIRV